MCIATRDHVAGCVAPSCFTLVLVCPVWCNVMLCDVKWCGVVTVRGYITTGQESGDERCGVDYQVTSDGDVA